MWYTCLSLECDHTYTVEFYLHVEYIMGEDIWYLYNLSKGTAPVETFLYIFITRAALDKGYMYLCITGAALVKCYIYLYITVTSLVKGYIYIYILQLQR